MPDMPAVAAGLSISAALAQVYHTEHSAAMDDATLKIILAVLERAPEWISHDLGGKDSAARMRAEETLAAMIASALAVEQG